MSVTFESVRFGTVEVQDEQVLEFPQGLIGLGGLRYALVDRNPGSGFLWLHSTEDAALALPVVRPHQFFGDFELVMSEEDRQRTGVSDAGSATMYVTVRAAPDPLQTTANLRAPLVINAGRGYQVLNGAPDAPLQAPLFVLAEPSDAAELASADAA
jgi:flagellar assembly factor FliW